MLLLENADIDFAFIQFYNNYCSVCGQFNWDTWLTYAQTVSPNKNIKLFLGLPGSASAAGSGYISDTSLLESTIADIASSSSFGGIALWDASQAFSNELNGEPYVEILKNLLTSASQTATTTVATSQKPQQPQLHLLQLHLLLLHLLQLLRKRPHNLRHLHKVKAKLLYLQLQAALSKHQLLKLQKH